MNRLISIVAITAFITGCQSASFSTRPNLIKPGHSPVIEKVIFADKETVATVFNMEHGACWHDEIWDDCKKDRQRIELAQQQWDRPYNGKTRVYSYDIYLPENFQDITPANTTFTQVKMKNFRSPLWSLNFKQNQIMIRLGMSGDTCEVYTQDLMRGKWTNIEVFADYSPAGREVLQEKFLHDLYKHSPNFVPWKGDKPSFTIKINGQLAEECVLYSPLISKDKMSNDNRFSVRFGIYNSYVSRWLTKENGEYMKSVIDTITPFADTHADEGIAPKSAVGTPFAMEWPIKLPNQTIKFTNLNIK